MFNCKWHKDGEAPTAANQIFVFGSNLAGRHGAGAAKYALDNCGARYGVALGLFGNSYAIATLDESFQKVSLNLISQQVNLLLRSINDHYADSGLFITRIGCGLAGFNDEEIAPIFSHFTQHYFVSLPDTWKKYYSTEENYN